MDKYNSEGFISENGQYYKIEGKLVPIAEYEAKNKGPEVAKTDEKKEGEPEKKCKKKLHPMKVALIVVGGAATMTAILAGTIKIAISSKEKAYDKLLNSEHIRTTSIYGLVDQNRTSVDELLDQDRYEYESFEKLRQLLNAKRRMIDPKVETLHAVSSYTIDYNDIDFDRINALDCDYYAYYEEMCNYQNTDKEKYNEALANFNRVCAELKSIGKAIDKYEKDHGSQIFETIANDVLVSKVVDAEGLNYRDVSNIKGIYNSNGKLKVIFEYNGEIYTTTFNNEKDAHAKSIAKDYASDNLLDAMHEVKILAADQDYDNMKTKKTK